MSVHKGQKQPQCGQEGLEVVQLFPHYLNWHTFMWQLRLMPLKLPQLVCPLNKRTVKNVTLLDGYSSPTDDLSPNPLTLHMMIVCIITVFNISIALHHKPVGNACAADERGLGTNAWF